MKTQVFFKKGLFLQQRETFRQTFQGIMDYEKPPETFYEGPILIQVIGLFL